MNIAKLEKKFGSNEFVSYIEISKPNLRNNLKQLFAMKNSLLTTAFALLTVTGLSQSLNKSLVESFAPTCSADSIRVFQMHGGCLDTNPGLFGNVDYSEFDFTHVASYDSNNAMHTWNEAGAYVVFCTKGGEPVNERTVFIINDQYVDKVSEFKNSVELNNTVYSNVFEYVGYDRLNIVAAD